MTKEKIDLIILPTLNYHEKLQTDNILSLLSIEYLLNNLIKTYYINSITIDGGEISTLSDFYFDFLFKLLKLYTKQIKVYTDFLFVNKSLLNNTDIINIKYSKHLEKFQEKIDNNIKIASNINQNLNIKLLDTDINFNIYNFILKLNQLKIKSLEIIDTKFINKNTISCKENIIRFLSYKKDMEFGFINYNIIKKITPNDIFLPKLYLLPDNTLSFDKTIDKDIFNEFISTNKYDLTSYDDIYKKFKNKPSLYIF